MRGVKEVAAWEESTCRVPMWMGGSPSGFCGNKAFGPQLPFPILFHERGKRREDVPYCFGHCCPAHGGPKEGEPIIFKDGTTPEGLTMWCAVYPGFENLQESPAGFDGNHFVAREKLKAALAQSNQTQEQEPPNG